MIDAKKFFDTIAIIALLRFVRELNLGLTDPGFLSIATKQDANVAIDTIDRAIK